MTRALALVDCQYDFLSAPALEPGADDLVRRLAELLALARERGLPVVHVRTTVTRVPDTRLPHWRRRDVWRCEAGTHGHASPPPLAPTAGEAVIDKRFFSAFSVPALDAWLADRGIDGVILAGVHLHACVRATALDAYARGLDVWIVEDAVGSDDPLHGAISRDYLAERGSRFLPLAELAAALGSAAPPALLRDSVLPPAWIDGRPRETTEPVACLRHVSPADPARELFTVVEAPRALVEDACRASSAAAAGIRDRTSAERGAALERWAIAIEAEAEPLAAAIVRDVGKPVREARLEVARAVELVRASIEAAADDGLREREPGAWERRVPLGVVAVVTPWNNPIAVPLGKIAPAIRFGNSVVWKPSPCGTAIAFRLAGLAAQAGMPGGALGVLTGGAATVRELVRHPLVDAVTFTGSTAAGRAVQAECARRWIPFQAELGGNNAALVWADADLDAAAREVASGAFGFAGQRCTATRRLVAAGACFDELLELLRRETAALPLGDPRDERTAIGPLVSPGAVDRHDRWVRAALREGLTVFVPHAEPERAVTDERALRLSGLHRPPVIAVVEDARHPLFRTETFSPILVAKRAADWEEAIALVNGVDQGLAAALFTRSAERRDDYIRRARAGILKLDRSTAGAGVRVPFGGWKASGVGPAEHGSENRSFYTRAQAVYR